MRNTFHLIVLFGILPGCAGALTYQLRGSSLAPAADAQITAKVDPSRNLTKLDIDASHLTPPERVLSNGTAYLVWARRNDTIPWTRLGALALSDEGRAGKATLTVSELEFDMQVSAETSVEVASPSGKLVFEQRVTDD